MIYDRYELSLKEWGIYTLKGGVICGIVSYIFYRSYIAFFLLLPLSVCSPLMTRTRLKEQRLSALEFQFKESILALAASISAGYSVENAMKVTLKEMLQLYGEEAMITREFSHFVKQVGMNRPIEEVLEDFGNRSGLEDVRSFAEVFTVAKRSGGELVSIMNHVAGVIRDKLMVKEEIITLTSEKRYEQKVMNLVPFLIVIYIDITSPGFFDPMYQSITGRTIMTFCMIVYGVAIWTAGRLMEIEV